MNSKDYQRRLVAILSADVAGYSRLMGDDEAQTVATVTAYVELMKTIVSEHGGRVQDAVGDNLLAEFPSVVEAVEGARAIQAELKIRNAELPRHRQMNFRIGINLGDVLDKDGVIYGDGVNIAARLEALARPGGICISGTAHDQVMGKLDLTFEFMGEQAVKNIARPVRAFAARMETVEGPGEMAGAEAIGQAIQEGRGKPGLWLILALVLVIAALVGGWLFYPVQVANAPQTAQETKVKWQEPADLKKMAFPLPDKPSIAVLPFDNLSEGQAREYIADGLTENIIAALANISEMFVTARNSTFIYKGKAVKIPHVAEELGVRYVLEGSVQVAGDNLRVTAQLIDATTGYHIWAGRFDRDLKDLFAVQDEITLKIVQAMSVKLTEGEQGALRHNTGNLEAWSLVVKASGQFELFTPDGNKRARELYLKALELDAGYAFAWTGLAWTYVIDAQAGFTHSPEDSMNEAIKYAKKAGALDSDQADLHSLWGIIYFQQQQYRMAIDEGVRAITVGPNNALSHILLAYTLLFSGNFEEAVFNAEKSIRLAPHCPVWYLPLMGHCYRQNGQYEKALAVFKKALARSQGRTTQMVESLFGLIDVSIQLGQTAQASQYKAQLLKHYPDFALSHLARWYHYKNPEHLDRMVGNLKKAGLPE